jgi:hypothetical protein
MPQRIELEPDEVAGLIRGAHLPELRTDTPDEERRRATEVAMTAMDALCGLAGRSGTAPVWNTLRLLERRELLAFATLMAATLDATDFDLADHVETGGPPEGLR